MDYLDEIYVEELQVSLNNHSSLVNTRSNTVWP